MLQWKHPTIPSDLYLHIVVELTFLGEWRYSTMASGVLCVTAPSLAMMQMLCAEWQATQALSVLYTIQDMGGDQV